MTQYPDSEDDSSGDPDRSNDKTVTPQELRNPRATRKGPDMPEDQGGHRTDPEEDYPKPDGSQRRGNGHSHHAAGARPPQPGG